MIKTNYVTVVACHPGWCLKEFYWETKGHFWNECWTSNAYDDEEKANSKAKEFALVEGIRYHK